MSARKPRLTDKVISGIIAATSVILAGDVATAFGHEDAETKRAWEEVCTANKWAKEIRYERSQREAGR